MDELVAELGCQCRVRGGDAKVQGSSGWGRGVDATLRGGFDARKLPEQAGTGLVGTRGPATGSGLTRWWPATSKLWVVVANGKLALPKFRDPRRFLDGCSLPNSPNYQGCFLARPEFFGHLKGYRVPIFWALFFVMSMPAALRHQRRSSRRSIEDQPTE